MITANEYAQMASEITALADRIKPGERDAFRQARDLSVYHLRAAARHAREVAEALAKQEAQNAS